jgi:hypothetical protein
MKRNYWLGALVAAMATGLMAGSAQTAPLGAAAADPRPMAGEAGSVQSVHWGERRYGYYYYPRRHYRYYGYHHYDRPYRYYYGYGPGYGYYGRPWRHRHHHHWW